MIINDDKNVFLSKNVLNNECDPQKILFLFQNVLFSFILWGMEFHEKHFIDQNR